LPKDIMEKLPEGEYYWHDIIGLDVYSEEGTYIGIVESVFPTGSNDVYVCRGEKREILLPAIADVIRKIDVNQGVMTVKLLEGL
jgi:16S rRNA processing protein RimM